MARFQILIGVAAASIGMITLDAATSQTTSEAITKTFHKEYYDVGGDNWGLVQAAIAQNLQVLPGTNARYEGLTTAKVTLGFADSPDGVCDAENATLSLNLESNTIKIAHIRHV